MKHLMSCDVPTATLVMQAGIDRHREELQALGFRPAFFDYATCTLHPSRHADGSPAQVHVLDGLPDEMVAVRSDCGRVIAPRATLIAGFERNGFFFTRESAARAAKQWSRPT